MPGTTEFYKGIAVVALVAVLPWVAGWLQAVSLFGYPGSAFTLLLAGPLCLIAFAGGRARDVDDDPDSPAE